jgi:AraC-like DNA-binding protein
MDKTTLTQRTRTRSRTAAEIVGLADKRGMGQGGSSYKVPAHGLTLFLNGNGRINQGGVEFPITRPLFWYLPANTPAMDEVHGPAHTMYVTFHWHGLKARPKKQGLIVSWDDQRVQTPRWKVPDAEAVTEIIDIFAQLKSVYGAARPTSQIRASALIMKLFSLFIDLPDGGTESIGHRALSRFQQLMHIQYSDAASIAELARQAGISDSYLRSLLRERMSMSPVKYRNYVRLARARDLLLSTEVSIKEAAAQTGFSDQLYFSRLFHRRFGMSPRELIRRHRLPSI